MNATAPAVKLTKAQIEMLRDMARRPQTCSAQYRPALKLLDLGLATVVEGRFSTSVYTITPAGRAHPALAADRDDGSEGR